MTGLAREGAVQLVMLVGWVLTENAQGKTVLSFVKEMG